MEGHINQKPYATLWQRWITICGSRLVFKRQTVILFFFSPSFDVTGVWNWSAKPKLLYIMGLMLGQTCAVFV